MSVDSVALPSSLTASSDSLAKKPELDSLIMAFPTEFVPKIPDSCESADLGVSLSDDSPMTASPLLSDSESKSSESLHDDCPQKLFEPSTDNDPPNTYIDATISFSDGRPVISQCQVSDDVKSCDGSHKMADIHPSVVSSKSTGIALKPNSQKSNDSDTEFDFLGAESIRRCASLKTALPSSGGAVSNTPKKVVRFADALGLDLASIRHIMNADEPPIVPLSALKDLKVDVAGFSSCESVTSGGAADVKTTLCFCFAAPGFSPEFVRRVEGRKVLLESVLADDETRTVSGVVCVANIAFEKRVLVRWTINGWLTHSDVDATYFAGDAIVDRFAFSLRMPEFFSAGSRMEFSVMYSAANETYWDSNHGGNYRVECYIRSGDAAFVEALDDNPFY